ncbi:MAG: 2-amino-4-hydroxy-6-hydroxymethyldihydropteridine diphosphokinase [Rhodospirillales bacterium]|nr:2-amino-4-hydroxy-6-hydroxymethyldihydropteridine diphosphokinase [Rhodospirillales bacterium]
MILIALGANLPGPAGSPQQMCEAALAALAKIGVRVFRRSPWYESAPVPPSDQPWFVNGVAQLETDLAAAALLHLLHSVERDLGRVRGVINAPRTIDLDLLDYNGLIRGGPDTPILPHPRLAERAFVLAPLADLAPEWRHPESGKGVEELIAALPASEGLRRRGAARSED